ncbi:MAG TPA: ABC transporter permease, partial [Jatrophihabitantaceae bacterium]
MVATTAATVPRVRVPNRSATSELRAIRVVWEREVVRFATDRLRMITSLFQPLLFLFVLGTGLSRIASAGTGGLNLRTFLFPGILAMAVLFTAMFSAASIVWDREFGFMREMLVAPVSRSALVLGKALGGGSVAVLQGLILVVVAPVV